MEMTASRRIDAPLPAHPRLAVAVQWFAASRAALFWLAGLFIALRLGAIALDVAPTSDAEWYYSRAELLAAGAGYIDNHGAPTAFWPVGWPLALAAVFRLFGASTLVVGLFNLVTSALGAVLLHDLARKLHGEGRPGAALVGRLAVLLYAVYPNAVLYVPLALTEVFYTTLLLLAGWLLVGRVGTPGPGAGRLALAGLVFGLATLVKAQTLVVVPLVFAIALLRERGFWRRLPGALARTGLVLAVAAAVVAPWTIRNHRVLGEWVAVSTNGGFTLLTGNNDSARGGYTPDDPVVRALEARKQELGEVATDAEARRLGMEWIAQHPAEFAGLLPRKFFRLWFPDGEGLWAYETGTTAYAAAPLAFLALRAVNQLWYFALLGLFAIWGWGEIRRRRAAGQPLVDWWVLPWGIAAYPTAICLVFSGQSRFHFPVMPWICLGAACWLAGLICRRDASST